MKRYALLSLLIILTAILPTSCTDDDMYDLQGDIFLNLTSTTWITENEGKYSNGIYFYSCDYWDFYGDGTGSWQYYYEENGQPVQETRTYFDWDFTPEDYMVIHLYIPGSGHEYWMIDQLTPYGFSSYVSEFDPNYVPDPDYYYQELWALSD